MSHVNRARAQRLMRERGLDAIVLAKPESYTWASGAPAGVAAFFRRAGACLAVVPADPSAPIQVVTTELFAPPRHRRHAPGGFCGLPARPLWPQPGA